MLIIPSNIPHTFDSSMRGEVSDLHLFLHDANGWHNVSNNYKANFAQTQGGKQLPPCLDPNQVISSPMSESEPSVEYSMRATVYCSMVCRDLAHGITRLLLAAAL